VAGSCNTAELGPREHSQSQRHSIPPISLYAGASTLIVCLFRWFDEILLSSLERLPLAPVAFGALAQEVATRILLCQRAPSPDEAEAVMSLYPDACRGSP